MKKDASQPYIIAETAYNHEGDFAYLLQQLDDIVELKFNAVKYHLLLDPSSYMTKDHPLMKNIASWTFKEKQWDDILTNTRRKKIDVIALCDDVQSAEFIVSGHPWVHAVEIHSSGLNDIFLLNTLATWQGYIYLGVGGSTKEEIAYALNTLRKWRKEKIVLMYGFQSYPTDYSKINLAKMIKLKEEFNVEIGYADHTAFDDQNNEIISILGAAMGVNILEKHYTQQWGKKRIDYEAAISKEQVAKIRNLMNIALAVYGDAEAEMSDEEKKYGCVGPIKKAIVARNTIQAGECISLENVWFKRTNGTSSLQQLTLNKLLGMKAKKTIDKDEMIDFENVCSIISDIKV